MRHLLLVNAAVCGALLGSQSALAQDTIRLRAISPRANDPAIIDFIAKNSARYSVVIPEGAEGEPWTPRKVIVAKCGSIQTAYVDTLQKVNKRIFKLDEPLTSQDSRVEWPACLHVAIYPGGYPYKLRKEELVSHAYMRLTGGGGEPQVMQNFFSGIDIGKVQPLATLRAPYVTRPVELVLEPGTVDAFWRDLQKEAKQAPGIETVIARLNQQDKGAVITAAEDSTGCTPQPPSGAPYNLNAVLNAFRHAKDRASQEGVELRRPRITVVDNGFFGADSRGAEDAAFEGSPFPRKLFLPEAGSVIAKSFTYGAQTIYPINFNNKVDPKGDSVHGTHVTGIVLGGPAFKDHHFDAGLRGTDGWSEVTILNVGVGQRSLLDGADQLLLTHLDGAGRIVNMSISYNQTAYRNLSNTFDDLFRTRRHLYIAAAGNDGTEVQDKVYPAGNGGPQTDNVITVAAIDDEGRFAAFSNQGARTVDLAAPGCEIQSWINNDSKEVAPLSGTSQAAPLVTFAAALLRTFSGDLDVRYIKARLVASGSLLHPEEQGWTAFRVGLNIPRALYWFDDYVRVRREKPTAKPDASAKEWEYLEYIGSVSQLTGLRCKTSASASNPRDIWAFKRGKARGWLYTGKANWSLGQAPCETVPDTAGVIAFTPAYRIEEGRLVEEEARQVKTSLEDVEEVIFRSRFRP